MFVMRRQSSAVAVCVVTNSHRSKCLSANRIFLFSRSASHNKEFFFQYLKLDPQCILERLRKSCYIQKVLSSSDFTEGSALLCWLSGFRKIIPLFELYKQSFRTLNSSVAWFGKSWPFLSLEQCLLGDFPFRKWTNEMSSPHPLSPRELHRLSCLLFFCLVLIN